MCYTNEKIIMKQEKTFENANNSLLKVLLSHGIQFGVSIFENNLREEGFYPTVKLICQMQKGHQRQVTSWYGNHVEAGLQ